MVDSSPGCNDRPPLSDIRKKTIAGLQAGDRFSVSRRFTEDDVTDFARISRDFNPVHFSPSFVEAKGFSGQICHGMLVASMITEIGGQIGWLASGLSFQFKKPVYIGDTIRCDFTLRHVDSKGRALATAEYVNQNGELVMTAELKGILPGDREKRIMSSSPDSHRSHGHGPDGY